MKTETELIERRAALLAQLFLEDLQPKFVAKAPQYFGLDFIVGFDNSRGGVNLVAIEVKSTERMHTRFQLSRKTLDLLGNSNVPGMFLVIDVKSNTVLYYLAPPGRANAELITVTVPLIEVDEKQRVYLRKLFSSDEGAPQQDVR